VTALFGDTDVYRPFRRIEERARFEQLEGGANRCRTERVSGRLVVTASQPRPKSTAADRPSLACAVDRDVCKGGSCRGMEQPNEGACR
jgi:hypothetical protein